MAVELALYVGLHTDEPVGSQDSHELEYPGYARVRLSASALEEAGKLEFPRREEGDGPPVVVRWWSLGTAPDGPGPLLRAFPFDQCQGGTEVWPGDAPVLGVSPV